MSARTVASAAAAARTRASAGSPSAPSVFSEVICTKQHNDIETEKERERDSESEQEKGTEREKGEEEVTTFKNGNKHQTHYIFTIKWNCLK